MLIFSDISIPSDVRKVTECWLSSWDHFYRESSAKIIKIYCIQDCFESFPFFCLSIFKLFISQFLLKCQFEESFQFFKYANIQDRPFSSKNVAYNFAHMYRRFWDVKQFNNTVSTFKSQNTKLKTLFICIIYEEEINLQHSTWSQ